uniref:Serine/threonine-protein phosphatase 6 regulatory ankyrin repeat subunit C-like n=1 Tax=Actinia tenebrosa TaxID=6105 RepID=A0A6P8I4N4_ACTTE
MEESKTKRPRYQYTKRQRGFSICHSSSTLPTTDKDDAQKIKIKTLPSILIHSGDVDSDFSEKQKTSYDCTHLNPSNTLDAAVAQNNSGLLERLLTSAANISLDGLNASGGTPIHEAAFQGKLSCLRVFMKFGADVNLRDREGWTPLHAAICGGDPDTVLLLLKYGASINAEANDGIKPIDMAMQTDDQRIVNFFMNRNESLQEKEGIAPLAMEEGLEPD